jgi:hypothetical protein
MLLLPSFFLDREIVISAEAVHGLIVSSAVEESAVAVVFGFCVFFASQPQQISILRLRICRRVIPSDIYSQTPIKIPASHSEEIPENTWPPKM